MGKLVQLILLIAIAWIVFRTLQRKPVLPDRDHPYHGGGDGRGPSTGVMRRCAYCNVHIPEGESTQSRGHYFCCEAHRDAFLKGNTR